MPILRIPQNNEPLTQGDVLSGLHVYASGNDWNVGGSAEYLEEYDLSLVLSRPCVVTHKRQVIVAAVKAIIEDVPAEVETFDNVRAFLHQLRDGHKSPDRFYLGQVPDWPKGRYYAHLDSLHSVAVPSNPELQEFLTVKRVATLTDEFRRDLHIRLFSAFASLGFDDFGWLSDEDLTWLLEKGESELSQRRANLAGAKSEVAKLEASGSQKNEQHLDNLRGKALNLEKQVDKFETGLQGYRTESQKRSDEIG